MQPLWPPSRWQLPWLRTQQCKALPSSPCLALVAPTSLIQWPARAVSFANFAPSAAFALQLVQRIGNGGDLLCSIPKDTRPCQRALNPPWRCNNLCLWQAPPHRPAMPPRSDRRPTARHHDTTKRADTQQLPATQVSSLTMQKHCCVLCLAQQRGGRNTFLRSDKKLLIWKGATISILYARRRQGHRAPSATQGGRKVQLQT